MRCCFNEARKWHRDGSSHCRPAVGASPLVITAHRKYASVGGIGGSCLQGGCVGVTSLTKEIVQFHIAEMLGRAQKSDAQPREGDHELSNKVDYGIIEFELVLQRSCEQRYWMRHIPSDDTDAGLKRCGRVPCQRIQIEEWGTSTAAARGCRERLF
ncbi:putative kinesin [Trypanosoma cruzi]|uniref:Putative kinesin n=1 Tax=Trypanosoma cruzi TaxID=5693 RepID=A0A2V2V4V4_TRYCR|nr:putative kinesin [Trypanosoma cruzi]